MHIMGDSHVLHVASGDVFDIVGMMMMMVIIIIIIIIIITACTVVQAVI